MNSHQQALAQLEQVAQLLKKDYQDEPRFAAIIEQLKSPDRVLSGEIEFRLDDDTIKKVQAFRSQHNNARGPYKGGIRFHPQVSREEVMALSTWMTWKCAVTNIPYGGGKGGVIVNPKELSESELERLSRAYAEFVAPNIGPWVDVPAPDVNTTPQIMSWMVDVYERYLKEQGVPIMVNPAATFTGKPLDFHGSAGRTEATGLGGVYILEKLVTALKLGQTEDLTIAIQGFGNVGYWFAHHAHQRGYQIVALSDSKGGIYDPQGLDPDQVLAYKEGHGSVTQYSEAGPASNQVEVITNEELLELKVDILVPAALENVITQENASKIMAQAVIELANGPTTPKADELLADREVIVVPDVLANAGGVTTSYFEWVQNLQGYSWGKEKVLDQLQTLMETAFDQVWQLKTERELTGRMAAYVLAVKRVVDAILLRGHSTD